MRPPTCVQRSQKEGQICVRPITTRMRPRRRRERSVEAPSPWLALRVLLTVAAAVLLLVGSFLEWAGGVDGSEIAVQAYWSTDAGTAGFFSSAGLVTAICVPSSSWASRSVVAGSRGSPGRWHWLRSP